MAARKQKTIGNKKKKIALRREQIRKQSQEDSSYRIKKKVKYK